MLPESSLSDNYVSLAVPPLDFANAFSGGGGDAIALPEESMELQVPSVRIVTSIAGVEADLVSLSVTLSAARSLDVARLPADSPVVSMRAAVSPILVEIAPPQVALAWRAAMANVAEVKAVWSWQYADPAARGKHRSILDLPRVRAALERAMRQEALAERARQAAFARAGDHLLDLHASVRPRLWSHSLRHEARHRTPCPSSLPPLLPLPQPWPHRARIAQVHLAGLTVTVLAAPVPAPGAPAPAAPADGRAPPLVRLEAVQLAASMRVWSDTAYAVDASLDDLRLVDANPVSSSVHRQLLAPGAPAEGIEEQPFAAVSYEESAAGAGVLRVRSTGAKVTLVPEPIVDVLALVFASFSAPGAEPEGAPADGALERAPSGGSTGRAVPSTAGTGRPSSLSGSACGAPQAGDAYSWWGDSTLDATLEVGRCQVTFVQEPAREDSARLVLLFAASGDYTAKKDAEHGSLAVRDVRVLMRVVEVDEPLYVLEKAAAAVAVQRTYANGAYNTITTISSRALDLLVTYQDLKRCFAIYRAFVREDERAGFSRSKGILYLSGLLVSEEEPRAPAPKLVPDAPTLAVPGTSKLEVRLEVASLCLVNDCMGSTAPFATLTLKNASMDVTWDTDQSYSLTSQVTSDTAFYNIMTSCFEPIMEPWTLQISAAETEGRVSSSFKIESLSRIDFNLSEMHLRGAVQTVEGWLQDAKTWGLESKSLEERFWPYRLRNESGVPISFWLGSTFEPTNTMCTAIAAGGEEPFEFSQKRALQARQRDMSLEFHTLSIRFEGIDDLLTHVPVDITGVHMLPLGDLRAVAEIHNDSGCKIIAIQSTFKLYNKTSTALDAAVADVADGPELWWEGFAGDMHGCVPLQLAQSKFLKVRPAGGKHGYCAPITIPTEPVTGESIFVRCDPLPNAPEGTTAMHLRVRLDAKRPVGGHEENMRIVVSLHPALRIQNALPYPVSVSLYEGRGGVLGEQVTSAVTEEGAVEQLYCADLKTPLMLSAFCRNLRRVREPVVVYSPDASVAPARALELLDDQGGVLRLGVEAVQSAWGDLTIVLYAHYLVRNFSGLPLTYGCTGTVATSTYAAAGQAPDSDEGPSPLATPEHLHQGPSLQGIFAGFGPRAPFHGRFVRADPPLADRELANAAEIRGAIAVITRGIVPFTEKARRAAAAGAIGVVFLNTDDTSFLAEGDKGPGIRIPCVMLRNSDAAQIDWSAPPEEQVVHVAPEKVNTSQRGSAQSLEWKRVVKATVRFGEHLHHAPSPSKPALEGAAAGKGARQQDRDGLSFPSAWMDNASEPPFMFSFSSTDLTGNRASFQVDGGPWGPAFSLESVGTNGVLEVPGKPSEAPELKKAAPLYEFGLAFELGMGYLARSKLVSIVPRYTVLNRVGATVQLVQQGLEEEPAAVLELKDGELAPLHWVDGARAKCLRVRVVPAIGR